MTEISITNVPGYFHLSVKGHAGYGCANHLPEGHDIVCAAISILSQTAVQRMIDMGETAEVGIQDLTVEPGRVDIKVIPKKWAQQELNAVVETVKTGFELLQRTYPDYVKWV